MARLQQAANGCPTHAGASTTFARKTGEAATSPNSVDQAKHEHDRLGEAARQRAARIVADPGAALASGSVLNFVHDVEAATVRVDRHLTDIMVAQDFHDLTGQVVGKVVALATDLEDNLVKLLLQVAPAALQGPVTDPERTPDVVANQGEVDELLASMGF